VPGAGAGATDSRPVSRIVLGHLLRMLLVAAVLAASETAAGPPAGTLRLCADPDNLPFSSATGPERGFYVDVGTLVAARLGLTVDVVWWRSFYGSRAVRNTLLADACDAYVGLPHDAGYMDRSVSVSRAFLDVGYAIMAPASLPFARLEDLKPHRVAVEFRTPPQSLLATKEGFSVITFRSAQDAVEALGRREVDAAFVWGPVAGYLNRTKLAGAYRIVPVAGEGMQWRVGIGVRKGDDALRRRIDEALAQLDPQIKRAAEHYGFPLATAVDLSAAPPAAPATAAPAPASMATADAADAVAAGRAVFNQHCSHCHSPNAHSPEPTRDLRRLRSRYGERMTAVFYETVTEGRTAKGMPPWKEILKQDDLSRVLRFLESVQSSP
jgi:polar amino acid transport system substrate-binding protein